MRAQLAEEQAQRAAAADPAGADEDSAPAKAKRSSLVSTEIAAALRSLSSEDPSPSQTTPTLTALLTGAKKPPLHLPKWICPTCRRCRQVAQRALLRRLRHRRHPADAAAHPRSQTP